MFNIELSRFNTTDPKDVIRFLEKWWVDHIIDKDAEYEEYKKTVNSKANYKDY
jgi:hemerythrin